MNYARPSYAKCARRGRYTTSRVQNGNTYQAGASRERIASNARQTLRDGDARQAGAARERIVFNTRHTPRNSNTRQAGTAGKRPSSNARHALRQADRCDPTTICIPRDGFITVIRHCSSASND